MTALLCSGIFLVLLIAGQDKDQVRAGLPTVPALAQAQDAVTIVQAPEKMPVARFSEAVFVPAQPVRVSPSSAVKVADRPEQELLRPENRWATITARSANVRFGPSTSEAVIGQLSLGEQVMIVIEDNPVAGWNLVRIEGDGGEGYVATRLLQPVDP